MELLNNVALKFRDGQEEKVLRYGKGMLPSKEKPPLMGKES
jgi:hypothetical protein